MNRTSILLTWMLSTLTLSAADLKPIQATIAEEMTDAIPGAAVVIVADGKAVLASGFGTTSVEAGAPVGPDTLFRLGSTTKIFVALAALQLAEQGKLDLHAPIANYAPKLEPSIARVTMHQLLSHTAGLAEEAPMEGPHDESAMAVRVEAWNRKMFFAEPGEIMSYANPGYVLAGYVIEQVTGRPFATAMRELLFTPLGMSRTTFRPLEAMSYPVALGHERHAQAPRVIRPQPEHAGNYPPGSLYTTASDLARFFTILVNDGTLDERRLLPRNALRVIGTAHARQPAAADRAYGYGVEVEKHGETVVLEHTGRRAGYGSIIVIVPSKRFAYAALGNRTGAILERSGHAATKAFMPALPPPRRIVEVETPMTTEDARRFAGTYANGALRVELIATDSQLSMKLNGRVLPVKRTGPDRFRASGAGPVETFVLVARNDGQPEFLAAGAWALRRVEER
jgi:CubicO group peptidase (beta-lactamase class C family)